MAKNYYDITLALAGICQAGRLVQQLAHEGNADNQAIETLVNSILNNNPTSTLDVFGNDTRNLHLGLETFIGIFTTTSRSGMSAEMTRYLLSILALERRLAKTPQAMNELGNRIDMLEHQKNYFEPMSEGMFNAIAGVYVDSISVLGPRIQVTGSPEILRNQTVQAKVRTILLAGIRSAVLWRQVGGTRLQLFFSRQRLINQAKQILAQH